MLWVFIKIASTSPGESHEYHNMCFYEVLNKIAGVGEEGVGRVRWDSEDSEIA